jgi:succinate-semialdehyde dehydrogenase/glutarate-semialdehyde dehydrogenase
MTKFDFENLARHIALAPGTHNEIAVHAPYTGKRIASIPAGREDDVSVAVDRARAAQPSWAALSFSQRAGVFLRFHDLLLARQDEILDLIQLENGKARAHAFEEVMDTAVVARYYARRAKRFLSPKRRMGALPLLTQTHERRVPVGVAGFIVPWNYPFNLGMTDAIPALLAGNAVVLKPDPQTSLTALWGINLLYEAGLPKDVALVVTGDGPAAGGAIAKFVDFVMFTGSGRTGRTVATQAAERLIGCSLELGGKNPMIVLADADLDAAADGAVRGCFVGAGQVCISIERIYVEQPAYREFLDKFAARTRAVKLGAAFDYSMDVGSMTSERQVQTAEAHVADALAKGATAITGGRRRPDLGPLFYEPTILTGVREGMILFAEETFGPVVSVYPAANEEEAIALANATRYGLSASVWTRDTTRGTRVAARIQAGSVNVNEACTATWGSVDSPIGGMKESGLRGRHGVEGILKFTNSQTVAVQHWLPVGVPRGVNTTTYARVMTFLLGLLRRFPWLG